MDDAREPASTPEAPMDSVWADLRRQHAEIAGDVDPCYLAVETYTGVVARYRYVPLEDTKKQTNEQMKIKDITDLSVKAAVDSLILAIEGLYIVSAEGEIPLGKNGVELYSLPLIQLGDPDEPPIKFDERLARNMHLGENLTVAQTVRRFFADSRTLNDHASQLGEWTANARKAVAKDVSGG